MGGKLSQNLREYAVLGLDIVRRRWLVFFLPIALAVPLAALAIHFAPTKYSAKSLILLQSSNRGNTAGGYVRQNLVEQVQAIDAWLKSDHVLRDLLPQITDLKDPNDPKQVSAMIRVARASIALGLVGGSALEVTLEGRNPNGLSKKLEVILARLMEGLTGPEHGIFNASQFVLIQKEEGVRQANDALDEAITRVGLQNTDLVRRQLQVLYDAQNPRRRFGETQPGSRPARTSDPAPQDARQITSLEQQISADPVVVGELKRYYEAYQMALAEYQTLKERMSSQGSNYVGIFDSAENVIVVGRPQDPIVGESAARKLAIVVIFLGIMGGGGLVWLVEMFYTGLRTRDEFEVLAGVPVIARLQRLPRAR
jgi:uncharacterized protein involved in exopolysaccharide biosynthesis